MKTQWARSWWIRSAETWLLLAEQAADQRDAVAVASALKHYDDALNEVLL